MKLDLTKGCRKFPSIDNSIIRAIGFSAPSIRSKLFRTTASNEELLHPAMCNESSDVVAHARISVACGWCILRESRIRRRFRKSARILLRIYQSETRSKLQIDLYSRASDRRSASISYRTDRRETISSTTRNNLADCSLKYSDELFLCSTAISGSMWFSKLNIVLIKCRHVIVRTNIIMCVTSSQLNFMNFTITVYSWSLYLSEFSRKKRKKEEVLHSFTLVS